MTDALLRSLETVSTPTLTTVLLKKGLRNVWIRGATPLASPPTRVVGRAFTLSFIPAREDMAEGAVLLRCHARPLQDEIIAALRDIVAQAPFRRMVTPGGHQMSVAMTNCGPLGWTTDRSGYRYVQNDPETGRPWPAMPPVFAQLAEQAAAAAGFVP